MCILNSGSRREIITEFHAFAIDEGAREGIAAAYGATSGRQFFLATEFSSRFGTSTRPHLRLHRLSPLTGAIVFYCFFSNFE